MATTSLSIENQWDFSGLAFLMKDLVVSGSIFAGGNTLTSAQLTFLSGVTAGTAAASKALVLGASKEIATITSATITTLTSTLVNTPAVTSLTNLALNATSTGTIAIGNVSTGAVTITPATTVTGAVTTTGGLVPKGAVTYFTPPGRSWVWNVATAGTDTAFANGTLFLTPIYIDSNKTLVGVGFLLGSVGGTDKVIVVLYDAAGNPLANSTTAAGGTTAGTAANTQEIAFTGTYAATGPGTYWVGVAANGATAKLRTIPAFTSIGSGQPAGSVAWTHGTVAAVTVPTTFTADKAPVAYVY